MTNLRARLERARIRFWWVEYYPVAIFKAIILCPCLCLEGLRFCFQPGYRGSDMIEQTDPIPRKPRERALTLPLDGDTPNQQTLEQAQSPLFAKLPLELRRHIYQHALGGANIYFTITDRKLHGGRKLRTKSDDTEMRDNLTFALGLLRSCRIIYSEAIEFLYSKNYMLMSNVQPPFVLSHITTLLLPQRLKAIQHLRINWAVDRYFYGSETPDFTEWFMGWEFLRQLDGLHYLDVRMRNSRLFKLYQNFPPFTDGWDEWNTHSTAMFEPVKHVRTLKEFVISLPHRECSTTFDVGTSNCQFQLPKNRNKTPATIDEQVYGDAQGIDQTF